MTNGIDQQITTGKMYNKYVNEHSAYLGAGGPLTTAVIATNIFWCIFINYVAYLRCRMGRGGRHIKTWLVYNEVAKYII